jgi:hypothetical protein
MSLCMLQACLLSAAYGEFHLCWADLEFFIYFAILTFILRNIFDDAGKRREY